jgi:hypothetical protein
MSQCGHVFFPVAEEKQFRQATWEILAGDWREQFAY